jgi:hypothetical protein
MDAFLFWMWRPFGEFFGVMAVSACDFSLVRRDVVSRMGC